MKLATMARFAGQTNPINPMINRVHCLTSHATTSNEIESSHWYMIQHNWILHRASCDLLTHQSTNNECVIVIRNKTMRNRARSYLWLRESRNTKHPSLLRCPKKYCMKCVLDRIWGAQVCVFHSPGEWKISKDAWNTALIRKYDEC